MLLIILSRVASAFADRRGTAKAAPPQSENDFTPHPPWKSACLQRSAMSGSARTIIWTYKLLFTVRCLATSWCTFCVFTRLLFPLQTWVLHINIANNRKKKVVWKLAHTPVHAIHIHIYIYIIFALFANFVPDWCVWRNNSVFAEFVHHSSEGKSGDQLDKSDPVY